MNQQYEEDKIDKKEWMAEIIKLARKAGFYGKRTLVREVQKKKKPTPF